MAAVMGALQMAGALRPISKTWPFLLLDAAFSASGEAEHHAASVLGPAAGGRAAGLVGDARAETTHVITVG